MSLASERRYSAAAVALHLGDRRLHPVQPRHRLVMEGLRQPTRHVIVSLHTSSGLTTLSPSIARIVLRLTRRRPAAGAGRLALGRDRLAKLDCIAPSGQIPSL